MLEMGAVLCRPTPYPRPEAGRGSIEFAGTPRAPAALACCTCLLDGVTAMVQRCFAEHPRIGLRTLYQAEHRRRRVTRICDGYHGTAQDGQKAATARMAQSDAAPAHPLRSKFRSVRPWRRGFQCGPQTRRKYHGCTFGVVPEVRTAGAHRVSRMVP